LVDLTPSGEKIITESLNARVEWVNELVSSISREEREQFFVLLTRLDQFSVQKED
jgi:DNA-binding MarR family transcriptional regulator